MSKFIYQHREVTLANGDRLTVYTDAKFFRILENSGDDIKIQLNDEPESKIKKGMSINLDIDVDLTRLILINDTGASVTIEYTLSNFPVTDDRLNVAGSIDTNPAGNTLTSPAAAAVTDAAAVAVAADSTVKEVILQNNGANDIWVGDSNVAPASNRGYKIEPGASVVLTCSAAIYARCAAGLSSTLSILKISEV